LGNGCFHDKPNETMTSRATLSIALTFWSAAAAFGQTLSCPGGERNPYLVTAPPRLEPEAAPVLLGQAKTMMEIGVRQVMGDRNSAKFDEYRDIPRGVFLGAIASCAETPGGGLYYRLLSRESPEADQHSLLTFGLPARLKVTMAWDRTLQTMNTQGRNHFTRTGPGWFTLPDGFQAFEDAAAVNLQTKRNTTRAAASMTPNEIWDLRLEYSREKRSGFRPAGANFDFSVFELPDPTDYLTHNLEFKAEAAKKAWVVQVGSDTSRFDDRVESLEWTNPFFEPGKSSSPQQGRRSLPPDNSAQNFHIAGAVDLADWLRIVATVSPGWMTQNARFLPFTSNSAIEAQPDFPTAPAASLNGRKQTLMMNYLATGQVGKTFSFNARYRSYDLSNETPALTFSNYVRSDTSLPISSSYDPQARRSLPYAYRKQNVNLDWIWQRNKDLSAKAFYEWEGWDRDYREVRRSGEHTVGGSVDLSVGDALSIRALLQHSLRRPAAYDPDSVLASYPDGMGSRELQQLPGLREYDEAKRSRNYAEGLIEVMPTELLSFSAAYTLDRSHFNDSAYGLLYDSYDGVTLDAAYALTPAVSVFGEYAYETYRYAQSSRERLSGSITAPVNDSANNDWRSKLRDRTHTWGGGLNAALFDERVGVDLYWGLSNSRSSTKTKALGDPSLPGFLANTAEDYPDTKDRFQQWVVSVKLPLMKDVSQRVQYTYERYRERDFAAEGAEPAPGLGAAAGADFVFLSPLFPRYRVHILSYTLSFVF
jgi:MtrB/PioB family decaheme-associated outer membrane protein